MKHLLLVRHAKSDWSDDSLRDFDRPLNDRGRHDAPLMARMLLRRGVRPTYLLSSPASRAYSTARLFADELGIAENDIALDESLYEATTAQILAAAQALPPQHEVAAVFTHNPSLTSAIGQFADDYIGNVPTCGVGHIELGDWRDAEPGGGRLADLWFPKEVLSAYD